MCFNLWLDDPLERRLCPELLALELQKKLGLSEGEISIVDINQAPTDLVMSILNYSNTLHCKSDARQMRDQQRKMTMWERIFYITKSTLLQSFVSKV